MTMKDPHVHVEKCLVPGFGNAEMRELILKGTGLACDMPKTVGTGCGRRRPMAMTSKVPENVTCLACREYARAELLREAEAAESLITICPEMDDVYRTANSSPDELRALATANREMAERYLLVTS